MSTTLKALSTLALERGRVGAGETFQLHNKTAAAELVAAGLAEEVGEDKAAKSLDAAPDSVKSSVSTKAAADKAAAEAQAQSNAKDAK